MKYILLLLFIVPCFLRGQTFVPLPGKDTRGVPIVRLRRVSEIGGFYECYNYDNLNKAFYEDRFRILDSVLKSDSLIEWAEIREDTVHKKYKSIPKTRKETDTLNIGVPGKQNPKKHYYKKANVVNIGS